MGRRLVIDPGTPKSFLGVPRDQEMRTSRTSVEAAIVKQARIHATEMGTT